MDIISPDSEDMNQAKVDVKSGMCRSIVRRIGSTLPLSNTQRPRFELLPNGARLIDNEQRTLFSLSDICQLVEIPDVRISYSRSSPNLKADAEDCTGNSSAFTTSTMSSLPQDEMVTKISALEDELSQLRSQIAMLVSNQTQNRQSDTLSASFNSTMSGAGEPASTSTPIKAPPAAPLIPPPPPFIPPPPPLTFPVPQPTKGNDVFELIKRRKEARGETISAKPKPSLSMADVLKDLHKVKLKSVSRSPGGTPMNKKFPRKENQPTDAVDFIAAALRKKFAHRNTNTDSPDNNTDLGLKRTPVRDKEWEDSPPKFGQHLLKKRTNTVPA